MEAALEEWTAPCIRRLREGGAGGTGFPGDSSVHTEIKGCMNSSPLEPLRQLRAYGD